MCHQITCLVYGSSGHEDPTLIFLSYIDLKLLACFSDFDCNLGQV